MRSGNSSIENIAIVQTCCLYDHHHFVECFSAIVCIVTQILDKCSSIGNIAINKMGSRLI